MSKKGQRDPWGLINPMNRYLNYHYYVFFCAKFNITGEESNATRSDSERGLVASPLLCLSGDRHNFIHSFNKTKKKATKEAVNGLTYLRPN